MRKLPHQLKLNPGLVMAGIFVTAVLLTITTCAVTHNRFDRALCARILDKRDVLPSPTTRQERLEYADLQRRAADCAWYDQEISQ